MKEATESLEILTKASVAEMLHEMVNALYKLNDTPYLDSAQQKNMKKARALLEQVVDRWIDEVRGEERSRRRQSSSKARVPEDPARGLEHVLDMLAVYHDDMQEADFMPLQYQRITIAAHNLLVVAKEIEKNVQ